MFFHGYLNNNKNSKFYYKCYNYGYLRDDSFKEAIKLEKTKDEPSIVISLGGYNDIINQLWGNVKTSSKPLVEADLVAGNYFLKQFLILRGIKRFFLAYKNYDLINNSLNKQAMH